MPRHISFALQGAVKSAQISRFAVKRMRIYIVDGCVYFRKSIIFLKRVSLKIRTTITVTAIDKKSIKISLRLCRRFSCLELLIRISESLSLSFLSSVNLVSPVLFNSSCSNRVFVRSKSLLYLIVSFICRRNPEPNIILSPIYCPYNCRQRLYIGSGRNSKRVTVPRNQTYLRN
jgi:hypothetical protein